MNVKLKPSSLNGTIKAISSKSQAHRVLIASALSQEPTQINCNCFGEDILATAQCLRALGAGVEIKDEAIIVTPVKNTPAQATLDCNESGSTLRFLLPVTAALGVKGTFTGSGRLPSRPIMPLRREMENFGVEFSEPWKFPIEISGKLVSGEYSMKGNVSSQFITGLLFALPLLEGDSTLRIIPPVESRSYIDMTLEVLREFKIEISEKDNVFYIKGSQKYITPKEITVEGDWSNSAFFLVAGAIGGDVTVTGLNLSSLQGDKKIIDILKQMGAEVTADENAVNVKKAELHAVSIDASDIPDLVPVLSVAGAAAESGLTVISNAERLRLKESDRLAAVSECLNNIGSVNAETDDGLVIWTYERISGGEVFSFNDHRIVMSMAVASLASQEEITIREAQAVSKSYPGFFEDFNKLGGKADVIDTQGE